MGTEPNVGTYIPKSIGKHTLHIFQIKTVQHHNTLIINHNIMSNLTQNLIEKYDYSQTKITPYQMYLSLIALESQFREIYEADGGDDTIQIYNEEHNILDFEPRDLMKFITPNHCIFFYYSIDEDYNKALKIYLECQALYITSDENIPNQGNNYGI